MILYYSKKCPFSDRILKIINQYMLDSYFNITYQCIDDADVNIPAKITVVPAILVDVSKIFVEGSNAFKIIEQLLKFKTKHMN